MSYEQSDFYCLACGNKGLPLLRPRAKRRERFHRKKLYCPYCRTIINHCECHTDEEVTEFKQKFMEGAFQEEAKYSLEACANA